MVAKVTKSKNIISGKNAKIYPKGGSIGTSYDRVKDEFNTLKRSHHKKAPPAMSVREISKLTLKNIGLKSTGKPATILYKKLPDNMILITGFENFKSIDNILDQYGRVVAITYNNYPSRMSGDVNGLLLYGNNGKSSLRIGEVCDKAEFSKIIAHVKRCGGLLHNIIQACDKGEVKRIEI